jgi:two-component system, OmpR family, sensor histidine kinase VanS
MADRAPVAVSTGGRAPGPSLRLKLTLSYAAFVVIVGIAVFALGVLSLRFLPEGNLWAQSGQFTPSRDDLLEVYVRYAWWTLLGLAGVGLVGGWLLAGIMLRPLTRITAAARRAGDGAFDQRVALPGRRDELTDLADTFDALLARVQHTLDEQRRFAANASHELRTPHAVMRTMIEVARADPRGRDVDVLLARLEETNDRSIALTESLLSLARVAQGGALERGPVALDALVARVVDEHRADAAAAGVDVDAALRPVTVDGHAVLLEQLVGNLVRNAIVHNRADDARLHVAVARVDGGAALTVANTGSALSRATVDTLTEPFVRASGRVRRGPGDGEGLGLAIALSIVRAHGGRLDLAPLAGGGLRVRVLLPAA